MKQTTTIPLTGSPNRLQFTGTITTIEVLGGLSVHNLQRLRVTLKISVEYKTLRLSVDLYHDEQVNKLIRKAAERLEIKTKAFQADLDQLTEALENYRFQQLEEAEPSTDNPTLSAEEEQAAQTYLAAPDLINRTQTDLGKAGIVGEETNRLLMYLIFSTRKQASPLHIISLGQSGTGKTYLQEKVAQLIPPEDTLNITALSENAFYYFKPDALQNKLLLIEDLDGAESSLYPLRELQSKGHITKTVVQKDRHGHLQTIHRTVHGNVSLAASTTKSSIYEDNADRCFLIQPDQSEAQDERILRYQQAQSAGTIDHHQEHAICARLQNCQRLLDPIRIVNPYAASLSIPKAVLKPRRTNQHYLQFIEAVTFYHQKQRPIKTTDTHGNPTEPYIETTPEDIRIAHTLLKDVLLTKADELSGACRTYFENVKTYLKTENTTTFKSKKIRGFFRINPNTQRRHMAELLRYGYIDKIGGDQRNGFLYQITHPKEYEHLQQEVFTHLEQQVETICRSQTVHSGSEQPNPLKNKPKGQVVPFSQKKEDPSQQTHTL